MSYQSVLQNSTLPFYPHQLFISPASSRVVDREFGERQIKILSYITTDKGVKDYKDLFEIESSSQKNPEPNSETRSVTPTIIERIGKEDIILPNISNIIDELTKENETFKEINKEKLMNFLSNIIKKLPNLQVESITQTDLRQRIKKIMFVEVLSGILSDLNPKEIRAFKATIKRRKFF